VRLLSPETIDLVFDQQSDGADLVLMTPFRFSIGYCLSSPLPCTAEPSRLQICRRLSLPTAESGRPR
jgi:hypothetical protein